MPVEPTMTTKTISYNTGGKLYVMNRNEAEDTPNVVISTFSIYYYTITVLFDTSVAFGIVDNLKLFPFIRPPSVSITTHT